MHCLSTISFQLTGYLRVYSGTLYNRCPVKMLCGLVSEACSVDLVILEMLRNSVANDSYSLPIEGPNVLSWLCPF